MEFGHLWDTHAQMHMHTCKQRVRMGEEWRRERKEESEKRGEEREKRGGEVEEGRRGRKGEERGERGREEREKRGSGQQSCLPPPTLQPSSSPGC